MTAAAIETHGLRKVYGRTVGLDALDLRVDAGEVFGFLGPNGAGKTTAVKLLLGLTRPTAGTGQVLGRPIGDRETRRRVGYLPELFRYQAWLSAREVLTLHAQLAGLPAKGPSGGDRAGPRPRRPRRPRRRPHRRLLEGHAAATRAGGRAPGRPGAGDPRRADVGARPGRARRRARDHPRGARPGLGGVPQLPPAGRGRAAVRPGGDRQPRAGRRGRDPDRAARRNGGPDPGDGAPGRRRRRGRAGPVRAAGPRRRLAGDPSRSTPTGSRTRSPPSSPWAAASTPSIRAGAASRTCSWAWSGTTRRRRSPSRRAPGTDAS